MGFRLRWLPLLIVACLLVPAAALADVVITEVVSPIVCDFWRRGHLFKAHFASGHDANNSVRVLCR